jgi:hypothetical protein|nr:MAG TPA: hypothetical protein [Caudoviricetes sp.]
MDRNLVEFHFGIPVDFRIAANLVIGYSNLKFKQTNINAVYKLNFDVIINDFVRNLFNSQTRMMNPTFEHDLDNPHLDDLSYEMTLSSLQACLLNTLYMDEETAYTICSHIANGLFELSTWISKEINDLRFIEINNRNIGSVSISPNGSISIPYQDLIKFNLSVSYISDDEIVLTENPPGYDCNSEYGFYQMAEVIYNLPN